MSAGGTDAAPGAGDRRPGAADDPRPGGPTRLDRPRLYEQLADHIADFIDAQGLVPGDRLPPERRLAKDLGVSRATLSRALVALEVAGRVVVRHGDGAVVRDPREAVTLPGLDDVPPAELRHARLATTTALALDAAAHPDATLRAALLADDGAERTAEEVWACILRLAGPSLLARVDATLAARLAGVDAPPPAAAVRRLATVVRTGRVADVPAACAALLVPSP